MRMIVIDEATDLQALTARLFGANGQADGAIDKLTQLNPHVDFRKIAAGTVLLVPEEVGLQAGQTVSVTGDAFAVLRDQILASLDAANSRVRDGYDTRLAEQKDVASVLNSAAIKRAIETDSELKPQVDAAQQIFKDDQQQAKLANDTLKAFQKQAGAELDRLAKMLGGA